VDKKLLSRMAVVLGRRNGCSAVYRCRCCPFFRVKNRCWEPRSGKLRKPGSIRSEATRRWEVMSSSISEWELARSHCLELRFDAAGAVLLLDLESLGCYPLTLDEMPNEPESTSWAAGGLFLSFLSDLPDAGAPEESCEACDQEHGCGAGPEDVQSSLSFPCSVRIASALKPSLSAISAAIVSTDFSSVSNRLSAVL